jgi:hypothetical protein
MKTQVDEYVRVQVGERVRLRMGEPRQVDWDAERERQELIARSQDLHSVPRPLLQVRPCVPASKGHGVFALALISSGSHVVQYHGEIMDGTKHADVPRNGDYAITVCSADGDPFFIDASDDCAQHAAAGIGGFMNHAAAGDAACNCCCVRGPYTRETRRNAPSLHVFARRDIAVGEELQWDYGGAYWEKRGGDPVTRMRHDERAKHGHGRGRLAEHGRELQ